MDRNNQYRKKLLYIAILELIILILFFVHLNGGSRISDGTLGISEVSLFEGVIFLQSVLVIIACWFLSLVDARKNNNKKWRLILLFLWPSFYLYLFLMSNDKTSDIFQANKSTVNISKSKPQSRKSLSIAALVLFGMWFFYDFVSFDAENARHQYYEKVDGEIVKAKEFPTKRDCNKARENTVYIPNVSYGCSLIDKPISMRILEAIL